MAARVSFRPKATLKRPRDERGASHYRAAEPRPPYFMLCVVRLRHRSHPEGNDYAQYTRSGCRRRSHCDRAQAYGRPLDLNRRCHSPFYGDQTPDPPPHLPRAAKVALVCLIGKTVVQCLLSTHSGHKPNDRFRPIAVIRSASTNRR